ncbi:hypothetical protein [Alteromonas sp. a30]|uniref:hypothetical protein n=1 Tax=Alteromonas sp. a30 TaxID=2730917 RepID=UPI0022829240|nr:hypothetical protein [Alteromonas sp. a30]MCY7295757.1 D-alanyl-alanine synthetase [Alteromonas sp. a30]
MHSQELLLLFDSVRRHAEIAIIYSGDPDDSKHVLYRSVNPRNWKSYKDVAGNIASALMSLGFKKIHLMEEGAGLAAELKKKRIQYAWLNTAGVQGFDAVGHCAALLQSLGIPYVGHLPLQTALMDDKEIFKQFLTGAGFRTAPFVTWHPRQNGSPQSKEMFYQKLNNILPWHSGKCVVKPASGRASQHVYVANKPAEVLELVQHVYSETGNKVLIEQFLSGKEYCISVMGSLIQEDSSQGPNWMTRHQSPFCFGQFERVLDKDSDIFTSMDVRPISKNVVHFLDPIHNGKVIRELNHIAKSIYTRLGLHGLIRLDLRMDAAGRMHVLEANPKPDLKAPEQGVSSLVAMGIEQIGLDYNELIRQLFLQSLDYQLSYTVVPTQLSWMHGEIEAQWRKRKALL